MMAEFIGTLCLVVIGCGVAITTKDTEESIIKVNTNNCWVENLKTTQFDMIWIDKFQELILYIRFLPVKKAELLLKSYFLGEFFF